VLALLARWSGLPERATARELVRDFAWEKVPRERVVFTAADDRWLRF
jgi:hypothetical protein